MMERRSQLMVVVAHPANHMAMMGMPSSLGRSVVSSRVGGPIPLDQIAVNYPQAVHYTAWERHIGYRRLNLEEDLRHKTYNS